MTRLSVRLALLVGMAGLILAMLLVVRVVTATDGDPTIFTAFGREAIPTTEFAQERIGEVWLRAGQGHDGKYFFIQAHDPLLLDPDENASILDRPLYRSQRMFYPLLAGVAGGLGSEAIVWAMVVVNILAMGAGTFATARVAQKMGGSSWWGLAFVLNVGLISEVNISGSGVVASAFAFSAVACVLGGRRVPAVALLVLSALSREVFLLTALGMSWWLWRKNERGTAIASALAPLGATTMWAIYLRARLGWDAGVSEVQEIGLPFVGFVRAIPEWFGEPVNLAAGLTVLVLLLLYIRRTLASQALVGWAFVGFALLSFLFTKQVWLNYFDITRVLAPAITAFVLMAFLSSSPRDDDQLAARSDSKARLV